MQQASSQAVGSLWRSCPRGVSPALSDREAQGRPPAAETRTEMDVRTAADTHTRAGSGRSFHGAHREPPSRSVCLCVLGGGGVESVVCVGGVVQSCVSICVCVWVYG